jgi:hypothetical protein
MKYNLYNYSKEKYLDEDLELYEYELLLEFDDLDLLLERDLESEFDEL